MDSYSSLRRDLLRLAVKWGEGVSRNGEPYGWLIDSREFLLRSDHLERVCVELGPRLLKYSPDSLAGYTLAAHPLALGLRAWFAQQGRLLNVNLIRREPKADGLQRQIEGPPIQPGQRVLLVDDLINSGSTQVKAVQLVRGPAEWWRGWPSFSTTSVAAAPGCTASKSRSSGFLRWPNWEFKNRPDSPSFSPPGALPD